MANNNLSWNYCNEQVDSRVEFKNIKNILNKYQVMKTHFIKHI